MLRPRSSGRAAAADGAAVPARGGAAIRRRGGTS